MYLFILKYITLSFDILWKIYKSIPSRAEDLSTIE